MNSLIFSAIKNLLDAQGVEVLNDPRRVDETLPVFANKDAAGERKVFMRCLSFGIPSELKKQPDVHSRLALKKRLAQNIINSYGFPVPVVKEMFDLIEEALYGSASSSRGDAERHGLRPPAPPGKASLRPGLKLKKGIWIAAGIIILAAVPLTIALYRPHIRRPSSQSIEEILKRIAQAKEAVKERDDNNGDNNADDNNDDGRDNTVVFLENYPGYGYQTADGIWHFVEGARRADGTVYRNGQWVLETPPTVVPPVSSRKPGSEVPAKDRQTLIEISREVAKHYDYHGDGVIFTEDGNVDCEDYAIAFYLLAKERGYNVKIVVSNTIMHAFNTVTINGNTYIVEPQAGEWDDGDLFDVDDIRYGGTWGNPNWRGNLYDLTDIEDNTKYYIEKYVL